MANRFTPVTLAWGNSSILVNNINSNFDDIATLLDTLLSRTDSVNANFIDVDLDMNNNHILNLPAPASPNSPVRLVDIEGLVFEGSGALYTTTAELEAGALDDRYYTETEVDALISAIVLPDTYTKAELNAGQLNTLYYTKAEVDAAILAAQIPTGTIVSALETGTNLLAWLPCNGGTVGAAASGSTYANAVYQSLFQHIWTYIPSAVLYDSGGSVIGKGATSAADWNANKRITLPDLRGLFLRGTDEGAGIDTGRTNGSTQSDANKSHTHQVYMGSDANNVRVASGLGAITTASDNAPTGTVGSVQVVADGGTEARPKNAAFRFRIKV